MDRKIKKVCLSFLLLLAAVFFLSNASLADSSSASYNIYSNGAGISYGGEQSATTYGVLGVAKAYELGEETSTSYMVKLGLLPFVSTSSVNLPSAEAFSNITTTAIQANWGENGNPVGTQYYCENITKGSNSGWITAFQWTSSSLEASTVYDFRVKAKDASGNESGWTALGTQETTCQGTADASIAGVNLENGDTIPSLLTVTVSFTSETTITSSSLKPLATLSGVKKVQVDGVDVAYDIISTTDTSFTLKLRDAISVGTHTLKIITYDSAGTEYLLERTGLIVASGAVTTAGPTLVYPNPYDPLAGNLKITYYLSVDTGTIIYVFDTSGRLVWKSNYMSGFNGGKAGYNEVVWNAVDLFGSPLTSDGYFINVIEQSTGKLITKTKLLVWKGGVSNKPSGASRTAGLPKGKSGGSTDIALLSLLVLFGLTIGGVSPMMYYVIRKRRKK